MNLVKLKLKGGSWFIDPRRCQSAGRSYSDPGTRDLNSGFRLLFVRIKHDKNNC